MSETIRISMIAVFMIILTLPLKQEKSHFAFLIGLCLGLMILGLVLLRLRSVMDAFGQLRQYLDPGGGYLGILLKVLGITYVCDFASCICGDAGYHFVAGQLEILGKLSVMVATISVLFQLIEQMNSLA